MNEIDDLSARLGEACGRAHLLVATAESCTAGGVAEAEAAMVAPEAVHAR